MLELCEKKNLPKIKRLIFLWRITSATLTGVGEKEIKSTSTWLANAYLQTSTAENRIVLPPL